MAGLSRLTDPHAGDWVNERLLGDHFPGVPVGSVVPTGFPRVVRVFHPAGGKTWAQVAAANDRTMHPLAQWCGICPDFDGTSRVGDDDPEEGSMPPDVQAAVIDHLPGDDWVFAVWVGWGSWTDLEAPEVVMPGWGGRDYALFTGPKGVVTTWPGMDDLFPQSASLVWPRDRAWCLATDIDWDSTLVAADDAVVEGLLDDHRLETFEVDYLDDLSWRGDRVNPAPPWLPRPL
ncbi:hypothetical protein [Terrabacter sp. BE26]|uniref:hypothetical protein n=1 Tax=Terrabacter sp. BE26 TaxID=2898152 RepID=UPI0035BE20CB